MNRRNQLARLGLSAAAVVAMMAVVTAAGSSLYAQDSEAVPRHGAVEIVMHDSRFRPDFEIVTVGSTVIWVNQDEGDGSTHDVYAEDGWFSSPPISPGGQWAFTFDVEGFWTYYCSYHENMIAQIMVVPADEPAAGS